MIFAEIPFNLQVAYLNFPGSQRCVQFTIRNDDQRLVPSFYISWNYWFSKGRKTELHTLNLAHSLGPIPAGNEQRFFLDGMEIEKLHSIVSAISSDQHYLEIGCPDFFERIKGRDFAWWFVSLIGRPDDDVEMFQ